MYSRISEHIFIKERPFIFLALQFGPSAIDMICRAANSCFVWNNEMVRTRLMLSLRIGFIPKWV